MCLMAKFFDGAIKFEHVTLTVTFDLHVLLTNFNIGHNYFILKDKAFRFGICVSYDKTLPTVPLYLNL